MRPVEAMKRKQFIKGAQQIAKAGAIQIFKPPYTGMEEVYVGVVGTLQFDVFQYRMRSEYGVELHMEGLPYQYLRWLEAEEPVKEDQLVLGSDTKLVEDYKGNQLLLFGSAWAIRFTEERNPDIRLSEFGGGRL